MQLHELDYVTYFLATLKGWLLHLTLLLLVSCNYYQCAYIPIPIGYYNYFFSGMLQHSLWSKVLPETC